MDGIRRRRGDSDELNTDASDLQEQQRDAELVARSSQGWGAFFIALAAAGILMGGVIALLPCPHEPETFSIPPPPEWTGPLTQNEELAKAERLFENKLNGPESFVLDGDKIYTSTSDGRVLQLQKGEVSTLVRFGKEDKDCGKIEAEPVCGRPLGMRLDKKRNLLVADAYLGLYRVNVTTGDFEQLLSSQEPIAGKHSKLLNDVEEGDDGTVYFTDSSTRWNRAQYKYVILEAETTGRLLAFNPSTKEVKELSSGISFANGLSISVDKTHILVAEMTRARILRYHLTGPKKGETDIFAENLPGWPDNIHRSDHGTYWVGLASIRGAHAFSILDYAATRPWIRALFIKLVPETLLVHLVPVHGLTIELDKNGRIVRTLHDPSGKSVPGVSEAQERDGVIYFGSFNHPFFGRLRLGKQ